MGSGHPEVQAGTCRARRGHPYLQAPNRFCPQGGTALPFPQGRQHPCAQAEGQGPWYPRLTEDEARVTCPQCHRPSVTQARIGTRYIYIQADPTQVSWLAALGQGVNLCRVSLLAEALTRMGRRKRPQGQGRHTTASTVSTCRACTAVAAAMAVRPAFQLRPTPSAMPLLPSTCE